MYTVFNQSVVSWGMFGCALVVNTRSHATARPNRWNLMAWLLTALLTAGASSMAADSPKPRLVSQGLSGYVSMDVPAPPEDYGYGVSLYSAAWPLLESPLRDFQIGLASIWIVPENRKIEYPLLPTGTVA